MKYFIHEVNFLGKPLHLLSSAPGSPAARRDRMISAAIPLAAVSKKREAPTVRKIAKRLYYGGY
jgi:hypothetical protein